MKLEFEVRQQAAKVLGGNEVAVIKLLGNNELVAESRNYVFAHFTFTNDWRELTKTTFFKQGESTFITLVLDQNDCCLVPKELLANDGDFTIHVTGSGIDGTIITTNPLKVFVKGNGIITNDNTGAPTVDFLTESVAEVKRCRDEVETMDERMDDFVEVFDKVKVDLQVAADTFGEVKEQLKDCQELVEHGDQIVEEVQNETAKSATNALTAANAATNATISAGRAEAAGATAAASADVAKNYADTVAGAVSETIAAKEDALSAIGAAETEAINSIMPLVERAETAAGDASTSKQAASASATSAANAATSAANSASTAVISANAAEDSKTSAQSSASAASVSASAAANSATAALASETKAKASETSAAASAATAAGAAQTATNEASKALAAATTAANSATTAATATQTATSEADRAKTEADRAAREAGKSDMTNYYDMPTTDALLVTEADIIDGKVPTEQLPEMDYVPNSEVGNAANKIPKYNASGHLVLPNGAEFWIA